MFLLNTSCFLQLLVQVLQLRTGWCLRPITGVLVQLATGGNIKHHGSFSSGTVNPSQLDQSPFAVGPCNSWGTRYQTQHHLQGFHWFMAVNQRGTHRNIIDLPLLLIPSLKPLSITSEPSPDQPFCLLVGLSFSQLVTNKFSLFP